MKKIAVSEIHWDGRARTDMGDIVGLAESIRIHGLIHPIVLDGENNLVAGGRRLTAMCALGWTEVPFHSLGDLSPLQRKELELEENLARKEMTWQETARLTREITEIKKELYGPDWTSADTATVMGKTPRMIRHSLALDSALKEFPELDAETDQQVAMSKARRLREAKERKEEVKGKELKTRLELRDASSFLRSLSDASVDLILFDPPYGVNFQDSEGTLDAKGPGSHTETYKDDLKYAEELVDSLLPEFFRVLRPNAHLFIFFALGGSIDYKAKFQKLGFGFQKLPLIWTKSSHMNRDPHKRFGINYEPFWFAFKGAEPRDLVRARKSVFDFSQNRNDHPSEKPISLYAEIITCSTHIGETVLDVTCGSGNSLAAAILNGRTALGCELSDRWFTLAKKNILDAEKEVASKCPQPVEPSV